LPLVKRKLFIPCSGEECLKLYELLRDKMPPVNYVSLNLMDKGLLIEVYGYETDVKETWFLIKRLLAPLKEASKKSGLRRISVDLISKSIHGTFPLRALIEVLRRMNYLVEYSVEENTIVTNASFEVVVSIASRIASLNSEASKVASNTSTRYYLASASIIAGLSIDKVIEVSLTIGFLTQDQSGKYVLTRDWRTALDLFIKATKK